ncbi:MAG: hypothetical protein H0W77_10235 [Acidobacteria bacterium]|nr:hypothetical protein [Acidobacteriota bacterium]
MPGLAINDIFGSWFRVKKTSKQIKKNNNFETVIPPQPKVQYYKDSDYILDSLSEITKNQSLTPEQIARVQIKTVNGEFSSLARCYEIAKVEDVKGFISRNSFLTPLLKEIPNKIYQYFGSSQKLALEVLHEPDFPQSSELWILVLTELSAKEARSIMNKFDKDWWLKNLYKADCKLNVGIEYV